MPFCRALSVLARADKQALKVLAEDIVCDLGAIEVLKSRTGLAMLPCRDTVEGTIFHLGEVLMAEAHIRLPERDTEGYGACVGRDLEHAMAMAVLDLAMVSGVANDRIAEFVEHQAERLRRQDDDMLRKTAATRVEMETF